MLAIPLPARNLSNIQYVASRPIAAIECAHNSNARTGETNTKPVPINVELSFILIPNDTRKT